MISDGLRGHSEGPNRQKALDSAAVALSRTNPAFAAA
jgi:hypothetical protein